MIVKDYDFWNEYKDTIKIKYDKILVDGHIKSDLRKGNFLNLEKAWYRQTMQHVYYILKGIDTQNGWICLDFGAGMGRLAKEIINFCFKIVCFDLSPSIIKEGEKYCNGHNIEFHIVKRDTIGRRKESINFIYSMLTFQHFHNKRLFIKYLKQLKDILQKDGVFRFQFCTEDKVKPEEKTNFNGITYKKNDMEAIVQAVGFTIVDYDEKLGDPTWDWITLTKKE